jgi:hypothetical protein
MLRLLHNDDLVDDQLLARLLGEVHLLDGHLLAGCKRLRDEDHPGGTLSHFLDLGVH